MSDNKQVTNISQENKSFAFISSKDSKKQRIYVHLPKDTVQEKNPIRLVPTPNSSGTTHILSLGASPSVLGITKKEATSVPTFTVSKTAKLPSSGSITFKTKQTDRQSGTSKSAFSRTVTRSLGASNSGKVTMQTSPTAGSPAIKVSLSSPQSLSNVGGKALIRSSTGASSSMSGIIVSAGSGAGMTKTHPSPVRRTLTLMTSGQRSSVSPGILRSPAAMRGPSSKLQVSAVKSSKPVIFHPKILAGAKGTQSKIISPNFLPLSMPLLDKQQNPQNKTVLTYGSFLQHGFAVPDNNKATEVLNKPTKEGGTYNAFNPPPLILQSGGNTKTLNAKNSGPATISIVTGKGSSNNAINIIPVTRTSINKSNMVNFKISNGQLQTDNSTDRVEDMAPLCDSSTMFVTQPIRSITVGEPIFTSAKHTGDSEDGCSTTFLRKDIYGSSSSKPKDILEEAMCAMASDIMDEEMPQAETELHYENKPVLEVAGTTVEGQATASLVGKLVDVPLLEQLPILNPASVPTCNTVPVMVQTPSLPVSLPVSSQDTESTSVVDELVQLHVSPSSIPVAVAGTITAPEVPGLIIRTDSVTVRRKLGKEEDRRESLKPDLSIIPILRNSSLDKSSVKTPRLNLLGTETFVENVLDSDMSKDNSATGNENEKENGDTFISGDMKPSSFLTDLQRDHCKEALSEAEKDEGNVSKLLRWEDGTGSLVGSDLKFCVNEFNAVELVEAGAVDEVKNKIDDKGTASPLKTSNFSPSKVILRSPTIHIHHARKPNHHRDQKRVDEDLIEALSDSDNLSSSKGIKENYDICCCKSCGCYGLSSEFMKGKGNSFCTTACLEDFEMKEIEWNKEKLRLEKTRSKSRKGKCGEKDLIEKKDLKENVEPDIGVESAFKIENGSSAEVKKSPWKDSKQSFSWVKYLEHCGKSKGLTRAAPLKLWQEPFPFGKNLFKVGMKLEGIDPQHQSLFCVMTVVDIIGHRIRLHFDGYSDFHDLWCNANSPNLFHVGWCEKNGRKLEIPPGLVNFSWKAYLEHCKASPAPKQAFTTRNCSAVTTPSNFRIGMKLEAEDRKNGWTCVATVADLLENRILVHFDGWEKGYDTWFDISSPFIHPVGWCADNGVYLFPPKDFADPDSFSWHEYLQETNSLAVPARAFKPRIPKNFKKEMKLEVVDKRNPSLVRVATIVDTKSYKILVHFDGWSDEYEYWVDDDSPDIHPPMWCSKTGHPLQTPLMPDEITYESESGIGCGTIGCQGYGHVKGLIYGTHHTAYGCPYSKQNIEKDWECFSPDRLEAVAIEKKKSKSKAAIINLDSSRPIPIEHQDDDQQRKRVRKRRKFFDELSPPENSKSKIPRVSPSDELRTPVGSNAKPTVSSASSVAYNTRASVPSCTETLSSNKPLASAQDQSSIDTMVHRSIFNPFYNPKPSAPPPLLLDNFKHIISFKDIHKSETEKWTPKEVKQFISAIAGCSLVAKKFMDHKIDGQSLLMITQQDLVDVLGLRLGPAIKIMASVLSVKSNL